MHITLAIKAVAPFASTDPTRPHLNRIHIEVKDRTFRAVATDGSTLAHALVALPEAAAGEWDIAPEAAKMLAGVKTGITISGTTLTVDDGRSVAALEDGHGFVPWRRVVKRWTPSPGDPDLAGIVGLDPKLLERARPRSRFISALRSTRSS
jgi:hypothetical protein